MTRGQTTILVIVALVIIGFLIYLGMTQEPSTGPEGGDAETEDVVGQQKVEGGSLVSGEGRVVNEEGEEVDNTVEPGSPKAPQQSEPVSEESLPSDTIKITITSAGGFSPSEFEIREGEAITLSVTSGDDKTHVFKFRDDVLKAVAVGIAPGETRAITFNAPDNSGSYEFYSDVPGQKHLTGVVIVR